MKPINWDVTDKYCSRMDACNNPHMWWNLVQQQFEQLSSATAAGLQGMAESAEQAMAAPAAKKSAPARKKPAATARKAPARKAAAKKTARR